MLSTIMENKDIRKDAGETFLQHPISEILMLVTFASTHNLGEQSVSCGLGTLPVQLLC